MFIKIPALKYNFYTIIYFLFLISFSLFISDFAFSDELKSDYQVSSLSIPTGCSRLIDSSIAKDSKKMVIFIQDVHSDDRVQRNISEILSHLQKAYSINTFCVEGSKGALDVSLYRSFPIGEVRDEVIDEQLSEGRICGAEHFAIKSSPYVVLKGVDNEDLYYKQLGVFGSVNSSKKELNDFVSFVDSQIQGIRKNCLSKDIVNFLDVISDFSRSPKNWKSYYRHLEKVSSGLLMDLDPYGSIKTLIKAAIEIQSSNMERVQIQLDELVNELASLDNVDEEESRMILTKAMDYQNSRLSFYKYLSFINRKAVLFDVDLNQYHDLCLFANIMENLNNVDLKDLDSERCRLEKEILVRLTQTDEQRVALDLLKRLQIEKKIVSFKAGQSDILEYERLGGFKGKDNKRILKRAYEFYSLAVKREKSMVFNTVESIQGNIPVVMIAGGYHTEGIKNGLKKLGISYFVVSPEVYSDSDSCLSDDALDKYMTVLNKQAFSYLTEQSMVNRYLQVVTGIVGYGKRNIPLVADWQMRNLEKHVLQKFVDALMKYSSSRRNAFIMRWNRHVHDLLLTNLESIKSAGAEGVLFTRSDKIYDVMKSGRISSLLRLLEQDIYIGNSKHVSQEKINRWMKVDALARAEGSISANSFYSLIRVIDEEIVCQIDSATEKELQYIDQMISEWNNPILKAVQHLISMLIKKRLNVYAEGEWEISFLEGLNNISDEPLLTRETKYLLSKLKTKECSYAEFYNHLGSLRENIDFFIDRILYTDNFIKKPGVGETPIFMDVSHQMTTYLSGKMKGDLPQNSFLWQDGKPYVFQYRIDIARTMPYFMILTSKNGLGMRVVMKDKRKVMPEDHVNHDVGNSLLESIGAPSVWVIEGQNYVYIREIVGVDIKQFIAHRFLDIPLAVQQRFLFSLGLSMAQAHILGIEDRYQNMVVNERKLITYSISELCDLEKRAVINIDRENCLNPEYLRRAPENDFYEVCRMMALFSSEVVQKQKVNEVLIKNIGYFLKGFRAGYLKTRKYMAENSSSEETLRKYAANYYPHINKRYSLDDVELSRLLESLWADISKVMYSWQLALPEYSELKKIVEGESVDDDFVIKQNMQFKFDAYAYQSVLVGFFDKKDLSAADAKRFFTILESINVDKKVRDAFVMGVLKEVIKRSQFDVVSLRQVCSDYLNDNIDGEMQEIVLDFVAFLDFFSGKSMSLGNQNNFFDVSAVMPAIEMRRDFDGSVDEIAIIRSAA